MSDAIYLIFLLLWHTNSWHHFPLLFHTSSVAQFAGRDHSFRRSFWCFQNLYRPAKIFLERFKHTFTTFKEVRLLVPFFQSLIYYNNWTVWLILTFGRVIKPLSPSIQTSSRPLLLTYTQILLLTLFDILCFWAQCRCASVDVL